MDAQIKFRFIISYIYRNEIQPVTFSNTICTIWVLFTIKTPLTGSIFMQTYVILIFRITK
jgi:hypothetical protein